MPYSLPSVVAPSPAPSSLSHSQYAHAGTRPGLRRSYTFAVDDPALLSVNSLYQAVVKRGAADLGVLANSFHTTLPDVFSLLSVLPHYRQNTGHPCDLVADRVHAENTSAYTAVTSGSIRTHAPTKLLERQLNKCDATVHSLKDNLSVLSVDLIPIHQRLVTIRRVLQMSHKLVALTAKDGPHKAEIKPLQEELRKIDSKRVDGKFLAPGGIVPTSQAVCSSLLEECFEIAEEIKANKDSTNVADALKPIHERLSGICAELESLVLTHRWTLRETDLRNYSSVLQKIDKMRVDGKFLDAEGGRAVYPALPPAAMLQAHYRLFSSEPVSEELMPIANKLSTVKECLNEVLKYGGTLSARDLCPVR
ncbi:hypothetical protein B0H13DRAFT_2302754 [Mycena leptocephala]|nr:hypothetical protein B0H13DRAFT_2302754 [Mycena leptocephala]